MSDRFRVATPKDAAGIALVKLAAWRAAYGGLLPSEVLDSLEPAAEEQDWRAYVEALPGKDRLWVLDDGGIRGFARTGPSPDPDLPDRSGEVHGLYLDPERIGTGLGRELFECAVSDLASRGFGPIVVWHFAGNDRAARFYERAGFRLDGAVRPSEFGVDEVRRRLEPT